MTNKKKVLLIIFYIIFFNFKTFAQEKIFIIYNVEDLIITNVDIKKESRYLMALNNQLKSLPEDDIYSISKESILRENIKKTELVKYFDLNSNKLEPILDSYIKNFYLKLGLNTENELSNLLEKNGLSLNYVKKKIMIEITWNRLIFDKYRNQIKIDEKRIKKQIELDKSIKSEKNYLLSEIVFEKNNQDSFDEKIKNIEESIKEIGFKNSANIYSISNSSKFGGEIGWVEEKQLSNKIITKLINLKIGQHTNPILSGNSFIILKINDIKFNEKKIKLEEQLKKNIEFEKNRQLEQFSKIFYNKIKINTNINEL